jgi:predicted kinase
VAFFLLCVRSAASICVTAGRDDCGYPAHHLPEHVTGNLSTGASSGRGQAFIAGSEGADIGPAGYLAGYAVATDNLRLGLSVVADSVNALDVTRSAWRSVAREAGVRIFEIELICSDTTMHRLRVEARRADIPGLKLPTWASVRERQYDAWKSKHLIVDTANVSVEQVVDSICAHLSKFRP